MCLRGEQQHAGPIAHAVAVVTITNNQGTICYTVSLEARSTRDLVQSLTRNILPCWEKICAGERAAAAGRARTL